jgi:hypothetical protein
MLRALLQDIRREITQSWLDYLITLFQLLLYATCREVAGSKLEVTGFSTDVIVPASLWPGVESASKRNGYKESSWG